MSFKNKLKNELQKNNKNNIDFKNLIYKMDIDNTNNNKLFNFKLVTKYAISFVFIIAVVISSVIITKNKVLNQSNEKIEYLNDAIRDLEKEIDNNTVPNEPNDMTEELKKQNENLQKELEKYTNEITILQAGLAEYTNKNLELQKELDESIVENAELKQNTDFLKENLQTTKTELNNSQIQYNSLLLQKEFLLKELNKTYSDDENQAPSYSGPATDSVNNVFSTGFTIEDLVDVSYKVSSIPFIANRINLSDNDYLLVYASIKIIDDKEYLIFYHKLFSKENTLYKVEYNYLNQQISLDAVVNNELIDNDIDYLKILKEEFTEILNIKVYKDNELITYKEFTKANF